MKSIIIIGSGPGISRSVARRFGKEGFHIGLIARREDKLMAETKLLAGEGISSSHAVADAGDELSLIRAIDLLRHQSGEPEMVLYNVSSVDVRDILEQKWETIKQSLDINAGGAFHMMKHLLPGYLTNNRGKLFITGGGYALAGDDQWAVLSVGKAALRNLVQGFVKRAAGTDVHIAQLIVCGNVNPDDDKYSPEKIAEIYRELFLQKPGTFKNEIIY